MKDKSPDTLCEISSPHNTAQGCAMTSTLSHSFYQSVRERGGKYPAEHQHNWVRCVFLA